jgi:hypothetical protein
MEISICLGKEDISTRPFFNNIQIITQGNLSLFLTQEAAAELIDDLTGCIKYFADQKLEENGV